MQNPGDSLGPKAKVYSKEQQRALEKYFRMDRHPSPETQGLLADMLDLKESQVRRWFRRRRATCPLPFFLPWAQRTHRAQRFCLLSPPVECTHFLLCSGPRPLQEGPRPEGAGSPGAAPPAPDPRGSPESPAALDTLDAFGKLSISTKTPQFQEWGTPEDQDKSGPGLC